MQTIPGALAATVVAFVLVTPEEFFSLAGQLALTDASRRRRVSVAHAASLLVLLATSAAISIALSPIPPRWMSVLALGLVGLALHAARHPRVPREQFARGVLTTFAMTLAQGGTVILVWVALLRANGLGRGALMVGALCVLEGVFLVVAQRASTHPRFVSWGRRTMPRVAPVAYLALAALVVLECRPW